jgi:hypothetical protein
VDTEEVSTDTQDDHARSFWGVADTVATPCHLHARLTSHSAARLERRLRALVGRWSVAVRDGSGSGDIAPRFFRLDRALDAQHSSCVTAENHTLCGRSEPAASSPSSRMGEEEAGAAV